MGHFLTHAPQQKALFDHLVGADEQRHGNHQAAVPGSLIIDDEFEFRRLIVGNITRLLALEDLVHGTSDLVKKLHKINAKTASAPKTFSR
jgi:hypothetical protein